MQALIIDAGNSRIQAAAWPGQAALPQPVAPGEAPDPVPLKAVGNWPTSAADENLPEDLVALLKDGSALPTVLVSVIPHVTSNLITMRPDLVVVDQRLDMPFATGIATPAAVGADRYCNVAAACAAGLKDALIVDAGTATTFDLLEDGCFLGGLIAPGMAFAAQKLGESGARLDPVPFGAHGWEIGQDTATAMAGGAWHVGVGGVLATIDGLISRYGPRTVVLTGGLGHHIQRDGAWYDPSWTLRGAAFLGL